VISFFSNAEEEEEEFKKKFMQNFNEKEDYEHMVCKRLKKTHKICAKSSTDQ
jgi:hypothetical protein